MAEKDILEKVLMSYADVFADCENVLTYGGRRRLKAEDICPAPTESFYRGKDKIHNQFSDVSAYLMKDGKIKLQYIIGNETALEARQVLRKASYQGGAYRGQLESDRPVYPVVGMVIDWTHKGTRIPLSLHELLRREGASEEDLELVDDVKLEVHHMNNLSADIRKRFTSDIGFVADYLNEGNFEKRRNQKIVHMDALCEMMEALTQDTRFTDLAEEMLEKQREGKEIAMCEYIDMLEARGEARGIKIGEAQGIKIGEAQGIKIGEAQGIKIGEAQGIKIGETKGEDRLAQLITILIKEKKYHEVETVSLSRRKRHELYKQYGI